MNKNEARTTIALACALSLLVALATVGQDYTIDWYTVDGGGETSASAGDEYEVTGAIAQPDARDQSQPLTGGIYEVVGGFWVIPPCPAVPCDFDADCDVDIDDFNHFVSCVSGPGIPQANPACQDADFEPDGDVDLADFGLLQRCFRGPDVPADPSCAN
jgi:hypothetical protein